MSKFTPKYATLADIDAAITRVTTRERNTYNEMHAINMSVLAHVAQHGDITVAEKRVPAITKSNGVTKAKVRQWFESCLHGTFDHGKFAYDEGLSHRDIDLQQANAVKWYQFKKEQGDSTPKGIAELYAAFLRTAERSLKLEAINADQFKMICDAFEGAAELETVDQIRKVA